VYEGVCFLYRPASHEPEWKLSQESIRKALPDKKNNLHILKRNGGYRYMTTDELQAIAHELTFWKGFVQTKRFLDGWVRDVPTPELRSQVHQFIRQHIKKSSKVLDVGSGVVSILNGTVSKEHLTAVDPLGDLYKFIFDYAKYV
jgi:hypothetical protein